jgi:hypothetical protein
MACQLFSWTSKLMRPLARFPRSAFSDPNSGDNVTTVIKRCRLINSAKMGVFAVQIERQL